MTVVGVTDYNGFLCAQHPDFEQYLTPFLETEKFTHILEIGTYLGGFTTFLKNTLPSADILTYDINTSYNDNHLISIGVNIRKNNIFQPDYIGIWDREAKDFISKSDKLLIVVDGGNKIGEFNALSQYLKPGDHIMCHDYISDADTFVEKFFDKIWNWHEVWESAILESCDKYNLCTVYPSLNDVVWQCKKKIQL